MAARFRIGIDLGGTKIEGAALDARGSVRFRRRVATPAQDYRGTIDAIIALISAIEQEIGATRTGRDRHSGGYLSHHRPHQECQLHLADRTPVAARHRERTRAADAACQ